MSNYSVPLSDNDIISHLIDILSEAQEYIFITSAAGRVVFPSPKTISLLNQDITGRNLNDLIDDTYAAEFIHSARQNMPYSITSRFCHIHCLLP